MTKKEAIALFGSARKVAIALGISSQAVNQWGGPDEDIPPLRAYQIRDILKSSRKPRPKTAAETE